MGVNDGLHLLVCLQESPCPRTNRRKHKEPNLLVPSFRLDWGELQQQLCVAGVRKRTAVCTDASGNVISDGQDGACGDIPPSLLEKPCNTMPCKTLYYTAGPWSSCSEPCGGGVRTRDVECVVANVDGNNTIIAYGDCADSGIEMPAHREECNAFACEPPQGSRRLLQDLLLPEDPCQGVSCSGELCSCDILHTLHSRITVCCGTDSRRGCFFFPDKCT